MVRKTSTRVFIYIEYFFFRCMTTFNPERAKFWSETQRTPEFQKFREGGAGLNGLNVQQTKDLMLKLGLPWDEVRILFTGYLS